MKRLKKQQICIVRLYCNTWSVILYCIAEKNIAIYCCIRKRQRLSQPCNYLSLTWHQKTSLTQPSKFFLQLFITCMSLLACTNPISPPDCSWCSGALRELRPYLSPTGCACPLPYRLCVVSRTVCLDSHALNLTSCFGLLAAWHSLASCEYSAKPRHGQPRHSPFSSWYLPW